MMNKYKILNETGGILNLNLTFIGIFIVFVAMFTIIYIFDNVYNVKDICEKNPSLNVCKINTFHIIILMLLLIAGGLIIVISTTAYILLSSIREV